MRLSSNTRTLRDGNTYEHHVLSFNEESTNNACDEAAVNDQEIKRISPELVEERFKVSLELLKEQFSNNATLFQQLITAT